MSVLGAHSKHVEHTPNCVSSRLGSSWRMSSAYVSTSARYHHQKAAPAGRSRRSLHICTPRICNARRLVCRASLSDTLLGVGLFFTPGMLAVVYAFVTGKGNIKDGLSKMLTAVSQGYFQPDVGGENIPVAQGELSDLAGDEPLFKALYQWWAS